mgnify:CR=1 FL=1
MNGYQCQIRNPRFASPGCRLHRHLGHTRSSFLLQGRSARGEILSAGGRGRQVPNSCSLESSASRVAQRSMDFFTIQRRDVSQRKPPLGAQKVQDMQCMHPSHGHMKQAYLLSVNTAESAWVCWCSNGGLEGYCPWGLPPSLRCSGVLEGHG